MEILNELIINQVKFQESLNSISKKLDEQAQRKPVVNLDHQAIVSQIKAGLPSPEQFEKVNEQIRRTISTIPDKIPAQTSGEILGFTNVKALLVHYGIFFSLLVLIGGGVTYSKNQEIDTYKTTINRQRDFIGWIQEKYPRVWGIWKKN